MDRMQLPGKLFIFEGPDGVGKTTLVRSLHERLTQCGVECVSVAFPGSEPGTVGCLVHQLHHDPARFVAVVPTPTALQLLHVAAHVDTLERVILPALRAGRTVILDRSWWSTHVYGREAGIEEDAIQALLRCEKHFWHDLVPAAIFLLTRSAAESEHPGYCPLSERYRDLARREEDSCPVYVIDNDGDVEDTLRIVADLVARSSTLAEIAPTAQQDHQLSFWTEVGASVDLPHPDPATPAPPPVVADGPEILVRHHSTRPSRVFDTYWMFAAARQDIFFRRFSGHPPPWTGDPILQEHKFTNAYRACDRVSQFLIRHVIREGDSSPDEIFFRVILFKIFNRIDTWRHLESKLGSIRWEEYTFERYDAVLTRAMAEGRQIYSAAYIMPSARVFGHERKHSNHLRLLELMMKDELPSRLRDSKSMRDAFSLIRSYHSIGDFLAYQYVTDLNYSDLLDFDEDTFVVAGPGARDGIRKCFHDTGNLDDADVIKMTAETQEAQFARLGISFRTLWGRPLKYIDCQNLFCEVDKYARVAHPEATGLSGRTRIKQKFVQSTEPIPYIFPKKWGLDELIAQVAQPAIIGRGQLSLML